MSIFKVAAPDLSVQDRLVLRAALRLAANNGCSWSCVDDAAEAEVVLRRLLPTQSDPCDQVRPIDQCPPQLVRIDIGSDETDAPVTLMLPLRTRDLVPQLRMAGSTLQRLSEHWRTVAPFLGHSALLNEMLDATGTLGRVPMMLRFGTHGALSIEAVGLPAGVRPRELRWHSSTIRDLGSLCKIIRAGASMSLEVESSSGVEISTAAPPWRGTVGQLLWALAMCDPQPAAMTELRPDFRFRLLRWPDVIGLPLQGPELRLAAVLARASMSLPQLAAQAQVPEGEATRFINACHGLGLLAFAPAESVQPPRARRPTSVRGLSGLVDSIRTALRVAVARESR